MADTTPQRRATDVPMRRCASKRPPRKMDLATLFGLIAALVLIAVAIVLNGSPLAFVDVPAILMVVLRHLRGHGDLLYRRRAARGAAARSARPCSAPRSIPGSAARRVLHAGGQGAQARHAATAGRPLRPARRAVPAALARHAGRRHAGRRDRAQHDAGEPTPWPRAGTAPPPSCAAPPKSRPPWA